MKIFKVYCIFIYILILLNIYSTALSQYADDQKPIEYVVTTTANEGPGSLADAIYKAVHNIPAYTRIIFNIPGDPPFIIQPEKKFTFIAAPVEIDATTQPGYEGIPVVVLDGSSTDPGEVGIKFFWSGHSILRGMSIHSFDVAQVQFDKMGNNIVEGCWIGIDASTGKTTGRGTHGVFVYQSIENIIGGSTYASRNYIDGTTFGITIEGTESYGNTVLGNWMGVNPEDQPVLGFGSYAIGLINAPANKIGGSGYDDFNIIMGGRSGLVLDGFDAKDNIIAGNHFGVNSAGEIFHRLPNDHILIKAAKGNVIGGKSPEEANVFGPTIVNPITISNIKQEDNIISSNQLHTGEPYFYIDQNSTSNKVTQESILNSPSTAVTLGATAVVTNTNDSGAGSLRQAITTINADAQGGTITFNIPGTPPFTIQPTSAPYPEITKPAIIDGTSQPGYTDAPLIEINGTSAGTYVDCFKFTAGQSSVKGLCINRFSGDANVHFNGGSGNEVKGCYLGTGISGENVFSRKTNHGVFIWNSTVNEIGGTTDADRNVIAGNLFGVTIEGASSTGNNVRGNYIGVTKSGAIAPGNEQNGVFILNASGNTIGGTTPEARNVICGNQAGLVIDGSTASDNIVQGNLIGTTADNRVDLGNEIHGVFIIGAPSNQIGTAAESGGNIISANKDFGITIEGAASQNNTVINNWVGVALNGSPLGNTNHGIYILQASNNTIGGNPIAPNIIAYNGKDGVLIPSGTGNIVRANSIHSHTLLGIDLGDGVIDPDGVTANDDAQQDADTGPNLRQNFPSAISVNAVGDELSGILVSIPLKSYTIEFYANDECNASGHGEGERLIGTVIANTASSGRTQFNVTLTTALVSGEYVTATATDSDGNTSEFSQCLKVTDSGLQGYFMY